MGQAAVTDPVFLNHITDEGLRLSLWNDHRELQAALVQGCWKTVLVLSGSMIEAVLIDYLLSSNTDPDQEEGILSLTLGQAIDRCKAGGILTEKTAQLCVVVKNYRNLIHPGRVKRKAETVAEEDARVAAALVKMAAGDVSKKRQETYGYTAEQIVAKLRADPEAFPVLLPSMLKKVNVRERRRLLFELLPQENTRLRSTDTGSRSEETSHVDARLRCVKMCHQMIVQEEDSGFPDDLTTHYVDLLHTAGHVERLYYESSFLGRHIFRCATREQREVIKPHLLSLLERGTTGELLEATEGIGGWFSVADVNEHDWSVSRLERIYSARHRASAFVVENWFSNLYASMSDRVYDLTVQELTRIARVLSKSHPEKAEVYTKLAGISRIPF